MYVQCNIEIGEEGKELRSPKYAAKRSNSKGETRRDDEEMTEKDDGKQIIKRR
jgi:hypothetical protein